MNNNRVGFPYITTIEGHTLTFERVPYDSGYGRTLHKAKVLFINNETDKMFTKHYNPSVIGIDETCNKHDLDRFAWCVLQSKKPPITPMKDKRTALKLRYDLESQNFILYECFHGDAEEEVLATAPDIKRDINLSIDQMKSDLQNQIDYLTKAKEALNAYASR